MSKSEKRYFSLDAQKSGKKGSRYLEVFRFLSDMDEFNDERLKKKFPKNLSSDKSYLYDAILRSMRDYRSTKSKAAQIKEKIQDSRYLFERGLYKQCDSRLQEANDIAKELGDELMILEVARERLLTIKSNKEKNFAEYVEHLLEDKTTALANVNQFFKYSDAYYEMILKVTKNFQMTADEKEQITLPEFFKENNNLGMSTRAEHRFYQTKALFYQLKGEKKEVLKYFKKTASWWDRNNALKNEEHFRYIIDISSLIYACIQNDEFEEANLYIEQLKNNKPAHVHAERVWRKNIYLYQLVILLTQKDYKAAARLVPEIDAGIEKYKLIDNPPLLGNISILYFLLGDYENCQKWVSKIFEIKNPQLRQDVQVLVRILNIICLFEGDDIEKLDNEIRSIYRFFKSRNIQNEDFEYLVVTKLNKIFKSASSEQEEMIENLYVFLFKQSEPNKIKNIIVEPLLLWLQPAKAF